MTPRFSHLAIATAALSLLPVAFLAMGVSALVEYELLEAPVFDDVPAVSRAVSAPARPLGVQALLQRNPFDSATGPVDEVAESVTSAPVLLDPLAAPHCVELSVYSTLESSDPYWSSAVIQGAHEARGRVRRAGDQVDGREVVFIGFNPHWRSPAVWFDTGGELCQSLLFDGKPRRPASGAKTPRLPKQKPAPNPKGTLPEKIAKQIAPRGPTEFDVDRAAVDAILGDYASLMRGTKMRPISANGKLVGLRITGIRPDSLLARLGWVNGDLLQSINGFALTSPEKALEAYARLRTAGHLVVRVMRNGKPMNLDYRVR